MQTLILGIKSGTQPTQAFGVKEESEKLRRDGGRFAAVLVLALLFCGLFLLIFNVPAAGPGVLPGMIAVLVLVGMTAGGGEEKKIKAGKLRHAGIENLVFKLGLGNE